MASGENIKTYFNGTWHDGDKYILRAADHRSEERRVGKECER